MEFALYKFIIINIIIIIIIIIIMNNWKIVKDWKNPCLAKFRQRCLRFYDSIFGQTIFRASNWTAKNKALARLQTNKENLGVSELYTSVIFTATTILRSDSVETFQ